MEAVCIILGISILKSGVAAAAKALITRVMDAWRADAPALATDKDQVACASVIQSALDRNIREILVRGDAIHRALAVLARVASSLPPASTLDLHCFVQALHNHPMVQQLKTCLSAMELMTVNRFYDAALAWYHFRIVMACVSDLNNFIVEQQQKHHFFDRLDSCGDLHHVALEFTRVVAAFETSHPKTNFTYPTDRWKYQRQFIKDSVGAFMHDSLVGEHRAIEYRDGDYPLFWLKQPGVQFRLETSHYGSDNGPSLPPRYLACMPPRAKSLTCAPVEGAFEEHRASVFTWKEETSELVSLTSPGPSGPSSISRTLCCSRNEIDKSLRERLEKMGPFAMVVPEPTSTTTSGLLAIEYHGPLVALRFGPEADHPTYLSIGANTLLEESHHLTPRGLFFPRLGPPPSPSSNLPFHDNLILYPPMQGHAAPGFNAFPHAPKNHSPGFLHDLMAGPFAPGPSVPPHTYLPRPQLPTISGSNSLSSGPSPAASFRSHRFTSPDSKAYLMSAIAYQQAHYPVDLTSTNTHPSPNASGMATQSHLSPPPHVHHVAANNIYPHPPQIHDPAPQRYPYPPKMPTPLFPRAGTPR
ncbi:hypothetical protein BDK51DRAFT_41209 [Blyttiomyces helicus]|uniref:Uncharacterized protein n=1 Tax=Blyttiomyces helicus TaxID=388810 RepID=A0A4P9W889_9FUNG|nr:hypothetical protein BDK51DRAFT_41209 [Blyttiomyces helicus]|eukprot:RKO87655.1 hypothetical protein BDK51DRAFT_41209 [Blyttiomyces helicus]